MDAGTNILGIDEAGRGPLIGPLVMCGFYVGGLQERKRLEKLPLNDSKALSAKKREALAAELIHFEHELVVIQPEELDRNNINELEIRAVARLIKRFNPRVAIVDAMVPPGGIPKLLCHLRYLIGWKKSRESPHLILENKADAIYAVCMAASILAKVARDREAERLRVQFGDFGSGYPSDPKTRNFVTALRGSFGNFSPHLRHKWATLKKLAPCEQSPVALLP